MSQNRNPKGQPTGGQFAAKSTPESEVDLADRPQTVMETRPDGTQMWRLNGKLHRDDGPAVVGSDGTEQWYQNGLLHRDDGPAVTRPNGCEEEWFQNGQKIAPPESPPSYYV